jgi:hypothetical protein
LLTWDAEEFFPGPADQKISAILRIAHQDCGRQVLDDGVEEGAGLNTLPFGAAALGLHHEWKPSRRP